MTLNDVLVVLLRVFGALYLVGGLVGVRQAWFWARIGPSMNKLGRALQQFSAEAGAENTEAQALAEDDSARHWWVFAGMVLVVAAGAAMLLAHAAAVALLAAIIVHQLLYFVRQRRRELRAKTLQAAAEARIERATINGFFAALVLAVLAAWLYREGALERGFWGG